MESLAELRYYRQHRFLKLWQGMPIMKSTERDKPARNRRQSRRKNTCGACLTGAFVETQAHDFKAAVVIVSRKRT
jgi:hypothetical protein